MAYFRTEGVGILLLLQHVPNLRHLSHRYFWGMCASTLCLTSWQDPSPLGCISEHQFSRITLMPVIQVSDLASGGSYGLWGMLQVLWGVVLGPAVDMLGALASQHHLRSNDILKCESSMHANKLNNLVRRHSKVPHHLLCSRVCLPDHNGDHHIAALAVSAPVHTSSHEV